jgi:hypothetical protein
MTARSDNIERPGTRVIILSRTVRRIEYGAFNMEAAPTCRTSKKTSARCNVDVVDDAFEWSEGQESL